MECSYIFHRRGRTGRTCKNRPRRKYESGRNGGIKFKRKKGGRRGSEGGWEGEDGKRNGEIKGKGKKKRKDGEDSEGGWEREKEARIEEELE